MKTNPIITARQKLEMDTTWKLRCALCQSLKAKKHIHHQPYPKLLLLAHATHVRRVGGLDFAKLSIEDVVAITAGALERPAFASGV